MAVKDLTFRLFGEDSSASAALRRLSVNAETASKTVNASLSTTKAGFAGLVAGVTSGVTGMVGQGVSAAFGAAKSAVMDFNGQLQNANIGFTTMLGSSSKAQQFVGDLQNFAKSTPFEFSNLVQNAQQMMGMGIAAKDVIPDLTALGDSVASMGGSAQQVDSVTLAFDQMNAKGTLDMGNMNQLMQNGVPSALKVMAAGYHVTTGEMIKMISTGKVQSSVALPMLVSGIEKGTKSTAALGGMMSKQSATMSGALSNIADEATQLTAHAFKPLFDNASEGANTLATLLNSPRLTVWANKISDALTSLSGKFKGGLSDLWAGLTMSPADAKSIGAPLEGLVAVGQTIRRVIDGVAPLLKGILPQIVSTVRSLSPIGIVLRGLAPVLPQIATAVAQVAAAFGGALLSTVRALAPAIATVLRIAVAIVVPLIKIPGLVQLLVGAFIAWRAVTIAATAAQWLMNVALDANPIGLVVIAIGVLIAAVVLLVTHWSQVCAFLKNVWGAVCKWFGDTLKSIGHLWSTLWRANQIVFQTVWRAVSGFFRSIWNGLVNWFVSSARGYLNFWRGVWGFVVDYFRNGWNRLLGIARAIPGAIMGFFRGAGRWLLDAGRNVIQGLISGITGSIGAVANTVANIAGNVVGTFKNILGIRSPSTVFAEHGKNIVQGLVNGLVGNTSAVHAAVAGLIPGVSGSSIGVNVAGTVAGATTRANRTASAGGLTVNVTVQGAVVGTTAQLGQVIYQAVKTATMTGGVPKNAFTTL